jgi:hypothetical protein
VTVVLVGLYDTSLRAVTGQAHEELYRLELDRSGQWTLTKWQQLIDGDHEGAKSTERLRLEAELGWSRTTQADAAFLLATLRSAELLSAFE